MQYDPIKKILGTFFNKTVFSRILFYRLLDLLMLRPWHIHKQLNSWGRKREEGMHVLDAGTGFGQYSYYLSRKHDNWNILSVDVNREQVCDCNQFFQKLKKHNVVFKTKDLESLKEEEAFDLILCIDVLEFIEEDHKILENFYASLNKGGMLLISTPSLLRKRVEIAEQVRKGYDRKQLTDTLKKIGFNHVRSNYSIGMFGKMSRMIALDVPVFLINISKLFLFFLPFYFIVLLPLIVIFNFLDTIIKVIYGDGIIMNAWK